MVCNSNTMHDFPPKTVRGIIIMLIDLYQQTEFFVFVLFKFRSFSVFQHVLEAFWAVFWSKTVLRLQQSTKTAGGSDCPITLHSHIWLQSHYTPDHCVQSFPSPLPLSSCLSSVEEVVSFCTRSGEPGQGRGYLDTRKRPVREPSQCLCLEVQRADSDVTKMRHKSCLRDKPYITSHYKDRGRDFSLMPSLS